MELPTGVLAHRLLKSADIAETMTSLSCDCMKKQLEAI